MLNALFNYLAHVWGSGHFYHIIYDNKRHTVQKCEGCGHILVKKK